MARKRRRRRKKAVSAVLSGEEMAALSADAGDASMAGVQPPEIPARFFFRFAVPCFHVEKLDLAKTQALSEAYRLPEFGTLEGAPEFVDLRAGWSETGLGFCLRLTGKRSLPWCRSTRLEESDGLQLLLDMRPSPGVKRATRYCQRFIALPEGKGKSQKAPILETAPVARAKAEPPEIDSSLLEITSKSISGGYQLAIFLPAAILSGFAPEETPQVGFQYYLQDRELGEWTFTAGDPFPFAEDPSLWGQLDFETLA
ncbi:Hypothetical protein PBC10988_13680 [Planctomycetales bacterium 10988]|nr:Hypothetical protein PBC10988_13680 [Planctomycetales bacterium 10988]